MQLILSYLSFSLPGWLEVYCYTTFIHNYKNYELEGKYMNGQKYVRD